MPAVLAGKALMPFSCIASIASACLRGGDGGGAGAGDGAAAFAMLSGLTAALVSVHAVRLTTAGGQSNGRGGGVS